MTGASPTVGVLAMQGAFAEHLRALADVGCEAREVRTPGELAGVDALVIPGGESTAIRKALDRAGLYVPLRERLAAGMPALGTCAGLVVLADSPADGAPATYGLLDAEVERNGFGRQPFSFEADVTVVGEGDVPGVFIRAPRIQRVGAGAEVIATLASGRHAGEAVAVRQGTLVGCTFHPELTADRTLHRLFAQVVRGAASAPAR